jgi:hypothetical protein
LVVVEYRINLNHNSGWFTTVRTFIIGFHAVGIGFVVGHSPFIADFRILDSVDILFRIGSVGSLVRMDYLDSVMVLRFRINHRRPY